MGNTYNIKIGDKFGILTVTNIIREKKHVYYQCVCECGKITKKQATKLINDNNISCGCQSKKYINDKQKEIIQKYTGNKIGKLKIIEFIPKPKKDKSKGNVLWVKALCFCGNEFFSKFSLIKTGVRKSCGHDKNKNLEIGKEIWKENFVKGTNLKSIQQKISKNNKTGVKGVCLVKTKKEQVKYRAYINLRRKQIHLGLFDTLEEAKQAREEAEEKYFNPLLEKYGKTKKEG